MKNILWLFLAIEFSLLCSLPNVSNAQSSTGRRRVSQPNSPCPQILTYETGSTETDRWYGSISLNSDVTLYGVWVDIVLDTTADSIGNWFGSVSSSDNKEFKIENTRYVLNSNSPNNMRFFVKYNVGQTIPRIQSIRLNGREICGTTPTVNRRLIPLQNSSPRREVTSNSNSQSSYNDDSNTSGDTTVVRDRDTNRDTSSSINSYSQNNRGSQEGSNTGDVSYVRPNTNSDTSYVRPDTNSDTSYVRPNTNSDTSYVRPNTNSDTSYVRPNSNSDTSYVRPDTNSDTSYVRPNSNSDTSYVKPNRNSDNSYVRPSNDNDDVSYTRPTIGNKATNSKSDVDQPIRGSSAFQTGSQQSQGSQTRPLNTGSSFGDDYSTNSQPSRGSSSTVNQGSQTRPMRNRPSQSGNDYSNNNEDSNGDSYSQTTPNTYSRPQATTTSRPARRPTRPKQSSADYTDEDYSDAETSSTTRRSAWISSNTAENSNDYFEGDHRLSPENKITTRSTPRPRVTEQQSEECGKVALQAAPLIVSGQATKQGQWPWHVALYQSQTVDSKYICGGSLVSSYFVITAAHCVTRRTTSKVVNAQTLTVYLGKFNLRKSTDGVQIMLVRKIYVHPEYTVTNYYADLALMKLTRPAEYTTTVRPVCLWNENDINLSSIVGKEGSVVGWGFDETSQVTEELTLAKMPVVEQATCLWSFKEFFLQFTSNHTYCAGFANGTSVCNGDSGGGMVFPENTGFGSTPTWHLRGLVSISVAKQNEYKCDPFHYVIFTDTAQFLDWIKEKMSL